MNDSDKTRFAKIMTGLAEDCSAQMSKAGLHMRFEALKQFTIDQVETAVLSVMRSNVYTKMPTTGTIIQAIEGTMDDKAEYQYTVVLRAIRQLGNTGHPKFKDPITQSLIDDRFGWSAICTKHEKDLEFFARDFKAAYTAQDKNPTLQIKNENVAASCLGLVKKIGTGGNLLNCNKQAI